MGRWLTQRRRYRALGSCASRCGSTPDPVRVAPRSPKLSRNDGPQGNTLIVPLDRMWQRVEVTRTDSDTALFYDLLYLGEMLTKLLVLGTTALVAEDRGRQRYAIEHALVRANSIGDWVTVLGDLLSGPASSLLDREADVEQRELTQRWSADDGAWQRQAVDELERVLECFDLAGGRQKGKAPLLRWFQSFAMLRNRTRGHGAPTGRACGDVAPHLELSLRLLSDNLTAFNRPWLLLRRSMTNKYRVIAFAGSSDTWNYLKSEATHQYADGVYRGLGTELHSVPLIYTDVDLSDFHIANGNFRSTGFEAISYISDDVRSVESTPYTVPATALPMSGTAAGPQLDLIGQSFVNLPDRSTNYIARRPLEVTVTDLVLDDRHPIITLVGRGGVGKTSVALEVLHDVAVRGQFFAILWFSARDIDLLPEGPKRVQPDVLTQDEIAAQFVELMNPAGSANPQFNALEFLQKSMSGKGEDGPFLFVFDNFETMRNAGDVFAAIDTYIRLPNKVLITSRSREFRGDYPVEVLGMAKDEFVSLAENTALRLGVSNLLTDRFLDELYEESDGHPYVVKVLMGEVAVSGQRRSVERVIASRDDILDALFERTFSALPPSAQRVFLTLANWRSIVPRVAVEAALLRPQNERIDVGHALDILERSSLIEVVEGAGAAEQFVRTPLAAAVFGRRKLTVSSMKTAIEADTDIIRMFGAAKVHEAGRGLEPRVERMVAFLAQKVQRNEDISEGLAVLELVARQYPPAWLKVADLFEEQGDGKAATEAAEATKRYLQDVPEDAEAWRRLARLSARDGDALGELHALFQVAELPGATVREISHVANRFNDLARGRKLDLEADERRVMAGRIRTLLEQRVKDADATTLSRLAWLCLHLGATDDAKEYAQRGLDLDPFNEHCGRLVDRLT